MATDTDKPSVVKMREHLKPDGPIWLLTTAEGFGVLVTWQSTYLIAWLSTAPYPELWAMDFGKSDNQVLAAYLPDEPHKTWEVAKKHLERKFIFSGEE